MIIELTVRDLERYVFVPSQILQKDEAKSNDKKIKKLL